LKERRKELRKQKENGRKKKGTNEIRKERTKEKRRKYTQLGRRMNEWSRNKALKTGQLKREDAKMFSVGLCICVYVRR